VLPVLSLERCLGLEFFTDRIPPRDVVVRSVTQNNEGLLEEQYAICRVGAAIRHMELPLDCEPGKVPGRITDTSCLTAVYDMQASILLVVNLEKILNADKRQRNLPSQEAAKGNSAFVQSLPFGCVGGAEPYDKLVQG
jgi:chemotaxis signal transduction protein